MCVDLDGTLVHTDSLHEAVAVATRVPLAWAKALLLIPRGKAAFKEAIYRLAALEVDGLPYNDQLIEYLQSQRAAGRKVILVTAADRLFADAVADHLQLFDEVIASDGRNNVRGSAKAEILVGFGHKGFVYAGNDSSDLDVWRVAAGGLLVNASRGVSNKARAVVDVEQEFRPTPVRLRAMVKAMRPHQWAKNVLVFLPIIASTEILISQRGDGLLCCL